jgi:hypothetical protein
MKPELKPPGTKRLKLRYGEPPSKFAFNFNWRRYIKALDDAFGVVGPGESCPPRHPTNIL